MARSSKTKTNTDTMLDLKELNKLGFSLAKDSTWASVDDRIPTGLPEVDAQIQGGMPMGRVIELFSQPAAGKSTLAMQLTRMATQIGVQVVWMDIEATADNDRLEQLGVDISKVIIWQPKEGDPTATAIEYVASAAEGIINYFHSMNMPVMVVWDSIGASSSLSTLKGDYDDQQPGREAKAITRAMNKLQPLVTTTKSLMVVINQVREKMGAMAFGPTVDTPGGKALKHAASVRFQLGKKKAFKRRGEDFGHQVDLKLVKSKVSVPNSHSEAILYGGYGLNEVVNTIIKAIELGIIKDKSAGSKGKVVLIPNQDGETVEYPYFDLLDAMGEDPEAYYDMVRPIFHKVMLHYFPNSFPGFENKTLDLKALPLYKGLQEEYDKRAEEALKDNNVEEDDNDKTEAPE